MVEKKKQVTVMVEIGNSSGSSSSSSDSSGSSCSSGSSGGSHTNNYPLLFAWAVVDVCVGRCCC